VTDPRAQRCIKDPDKFLDRIDKNVYKEIKRWMRKNAANK
jgi:hypothetical protein